MPAPSAAHRIVHPGKQPIAAVANLDENINTLLFDLDQELTPGFYAELDGRWRRAGDRNVLGGRQDARRECAGAGWRAGR